MFPLFVINTRGEAGGGGGEGVDGNVEGEMGSTYRCCFRAAPEVF